MTGGTQNEKLLEDTAIVKAMQKEYPFLKNWRDYHFEDMRGIYNSKFESICAEIAGKSDYRSKWNCLNLFSIIDTVINRGRVKEDDAIWTTIKKLFDRHKETIDFRSNIITRYINDMGKELQDILLEDFKKFKSTHENNYEFAHIAMLFYFTQNVVDIRELMNARSNTHFASSCKFVNHCLEIYRRIKHLKCSVNSPPNSRGSTLCVELNNFLQRYKELLYPKLKEWHIVDAPEKTDDPTIFPLKCANEVPESGFFSRYIENENHLSLGGKVGVISFSAIFVSLSLFMLYKFTPLGNIFGRDRRRRGRTWIDMGNGYGQEMDDDMSSIDPGSEGTQYMPYYDSQRMGGNGNYGMQSFDSSTTTGSGSTLRSTSYDSSQTLGGSPYGSSQTLGGSSYGSSQTFGSSTGGSSQTFGGSTGGSSQTFGGSTGGSSQTFGGSSYGPSQTFGSSTGASSQASGASQRGGPGTSRSSKRRVSQTSGGSGGRSSQTPGGSSYGSSQTLGGSSYS
ncbi:KIR-like protein [Plasmodium knowlesi strain H]|uniref:KIR-like protein n=3 Tax=Plasmodium knowlesi TaxID=5850 RepID=A0A5K1U596_PLAKH|nr:KIR protein [Plasmodium knowlesi strain H]OTN66156.1 KIR-like protein [Plasmodium knowlesi]CAA9986272.1 KIR protein [Plasmodium knowlesi strain H]SBO25485.1 KIR-like protein [Plasmodium knowlesi strain H]SBO28260.1 KIR-like protein [Plasmodium knowlesi strain H]VVS75746.1 KIR protein [Plasmodium knowlesi strain H]|eukprot:XP_002257680.1 KIR-like protein [Plasmodium knowlesi strain H]